MPEGIPNPDNKVCRLKKSLYGLKQASRQWFAKLVQELHFQGFTQSKNDYSLFTKHNDAHFTVVAVYVDNILVTGNDSTEIHSLKAHLHKVFSIKDLGVLHYFLGIEVSYFSNGIILTQEKFTRELLADSGFTSFPKVATPLPLHLKLLAHDDNLISDPTLYWSLVGNLNFLTNTRLDLSFTVQALSQHMQNPRDSHLNALHHALSYVYHTSGRGIILQGTDKLTLQAFSDSNWGSCVDS